MKSLKCLIALFFIFFVQFSFAQSSQNNINSVSAAKPAQPVNLSKAKPIVQNDGQSNQQSVKISMAQPVTFTDDAIVPDPAKKMVIQKATAVVVAQEDKKKN